MGVTSPHQELDKLFADRGLVYLGSCEPQCHEDFDRYQSWLRSRRHGGLSYLERNQEVREHPEKLLEGVRSVVVFALPYNHDGNPMAAKYAQFRDYHKILRKEGDQVFRSFLGSQNEIFRVMVDSAPVLERAFAVKAGNGFIGKNTCFIHPEKGSFLLLAEIFTTLNIPPSDTTAMPNCGTCTLCQVACPTDALSTDYVLDANRCLAYWTIEHRGPIPEEFHPHLKDTVFGCDICQTVCPYNHSARGNALPGWVSTVTLPSLAEIAQMDESGYERMFAGTPFTRAKREGLIRNATLSLGK